MLLSTPVLVVRWNINGNYKLSAMLKNVKRRIKLELSFARDIFSYWNKVRMYNASVNTESDKMKMRYTILRENHVLEKGMSMRDTRDWFGLDKISALVTKLNCYVEKYGVDDFLIYPLKTISSYFTYFEKQKEIPEKAKAIKSRLCILMTKCQTVLDFENIGAGVMYESRGNIQRLGNGSFEELVNSRHSLRYFENRTVKREDIEKILKIAQRTPSACNRQGWHTHVYEGTLCEQLLKWQGGCHGFEEDIHTSILVTADMKAFLLYEIFQPYVDGGLYAMNLINAIHAVGLGSIPLSCGFNMDKLKHLREFGIPENEIPVVLVGLGYLPENLKVAVSTRKSIEETNMYH